MMRALGLLLGLVLLAGAAWTGLWFYAAGEARRALDGWIVGEAAQDRRWTCPGMEVRGFPAALEIACDRPTFAGLALGTQAAASAAAARARVGILDPRHGTLRLDAPLTYRTIDGATNVVASWSRMAIEVDGLPAAVAGGTLSGTDVALHGTIAAAAVQMPAAGKLDLAVAPVAAAADPTLDFSLSIDAMAVAAVDRALGDTVPVSSIFTGRLTQAVFQDAETLAASTERWRQRGGSIDVSSARLSRGPARVDLSGSLHLDGAHRIEGKLDASFAGAAPILRRYGIDPNMVAAGSVLTSLFERRDGAPKPPDTPGAIRLPLQFRNGRLGVGPVNTSVALPPLY